MTKTLFINAGVPSAAKQRGDDLKDSVIQLMSVPADDANQGWRVIATYPASKATDQGYRSAHARAQKIRHGKVTYFNQYGKWDARARFMGDGMVGLYCRWLGQDGDRWSA